MHAIRAIRLDARHAELRCPCGQRCLVGDLATHQDGLNAFLQGHRDHAPEAPATGPSGIQ